MYLDFLRYLKVFGNFGVGGVMAALSMEGTSSRVMVQQPALHLGLHGARTCSVSASRLLLLRTGALVVSLPSGFGIQRSVVADATGRDSRYAPHISALALIF